MKRSEIREQVRFLGLVEKHDVSDAQLDVLIDEGFGVVEARSVWPWSLVRVNARIETTKGADKYTIPDFSHIISIIKRDGSKQLRSASAQDMAIHGHEQYGEPELYRAEGGKIMLSPIPDEYDYKYNVIYTATPEWRLSSESPPFASQFHSMLTDWTLHRIWEREEDFSKSNDYRSRFESRLGDMSSFYNTRAVDRPLIYGQRQLDTDKPLFPPLGAQPTLKGSS